MGQGQPRTTSVSPWAHRVGDGPNPVSLAWLWEGCRVARRGPVFKDLFHQEDNVQPQSAALQGQGGAEEGETGPHWEGSDRPEGQAATQTLNLGGKE